MSRVIYTCQPLSQLTALTTQCVFNSLTVQYVLIALDSKDNIVLNGQGGQDLL